MKSNLKRILTLAICLLLCCALIPEAYAGNAQTIGMEFSQNAEPNAKPAAPKLTAKLSSGKPCLTWPAVKGAVKYQVYRSTTGKDGSFKLVKTVTDLKYTHSKAEAGKTYFYKVRAVNKSGTKGVFSAVTSLTAKPTAPQAKGSLNSKDKPVLTWAAVTGAVKYQIYRSETGKAGSFKLVKTVTGTKYTHSKAEAGKTYSYKVRAVTEDGTRSAFSAVVEIQTPSKVSFIVNTNTGKYHIPTCTYVSTIKPEHVLEFAGTREELDEMGYSPCKRCCG